MGENLQVVRSAYEAFNSGRMRDFFALLDREIEWKAEPGGIDPATRAGHSGVERYFETRLEVWEHLREVPERLIEAGDQVVAIVDARGRGRGSGIELKERIGHLWTLRDGKVIRFEAFADAEAALEAAGIREERE